MSHFAILVISDEKPTNEYLTKTLQPWHEYECTGKKDQYVVPVDVTDEVREEYERPVNVVVMPDGQVLSRYDDSLYHPTLTKRAIEVLRSKHADELEGRSEEWIAGFMKKTIEAAVSDPPRYGLSSLDVSKEFLLPDQAEEKELTAEEARTHALGYASMAEAAQDYFGIDEDEERPADAIEGHVYRWTNPNKKWDWWTVGGRWSGVLAPRYEPSKDPANQETCWLCQGTGTRCDSVTQNLPIKCNGCRGTGISVKFSSQWKKVAQDRCRVSDLDLDALRDDAEEKALREYDKYKAIVGDLPVPSWEEIRVANVDRSQEGWERARKLFNEDPAVLALQEDAKKREDYIWDMPQICDRLRLTRDQRAAQARRDAPVLFGYVKDGKWIEKGEMGWFAMVSNEQDPNAWAEHYNEMLASLRPDQWVTVVDCHI